MRAQLRWMMMRVDILDVWERRWVALRSKGDSTTTYFNESSARIWSKSSCCFLRVLGCSFALAFFGGDFTCLTCGSATISASPLPVKFGSAPCAGTGVAADFFFFFFVWQNYIAKAYRREITAYFLGFGGLLGFRRLLVVGIFFWSWKLMKSGEYGYRRFHTWCLAYSSESYDMLIAIPWTRSVWILFIARMLKIIRSRGPSQSQ